jgi:ethanolamine ammonia-lyase small subunit
MKQLIDTIGELVKAILQVVILGDRPDKRDNNDHPNQRAS